ncbi:hypothetical protein BO94DRAFT_34922 [Aspergillus sclerotioniger CBS 115572]|uniref:Uncharacterized protein n=1 Tax=Aspergillus sclerotioniger CBS 115572 TaxID=1450535 RepID=A0A317WSV6_9EURO|nr:hypothetical protein BO94DRAFT_34922 [Aspergillus sclerotioniger CBS 115572]PWY89419.1 hypothetical protein BO94DRAFT_34922 [Aspergillus sclerotioniger CBS 115572]
MAKIENMAISLDSQVCIPWAHPSLSFPQTKIKFCLFRRCSFLLVYHHLPPTAAVASSMSPISGPPLLRGEEASEYRRSIRYVVDIVSGLPRTAANRWGLYVPVQEASPTDAIGIVQTQQAVLVVEAQQHLRQVMMLYDMGVALGMIPLTPRLRRILATAQDNIHLLWAENGREGMSS